jgi:hypothetical protein
MLKVSLMFQEISLRKGGTMVPEEVIRPDAEASIQAFLFKRRGGGYMNSQGIFDIEEEALALQSVAGWNAPDTVEPDMAALDTAKAAGWLLSGCFDAEGVFSESSVFGQGPEPFLAFGDEDDEDDIDDDEDNFDDMEDDFEDDFEDEDDDFEDEDDDFEDEDDEFEDDYDEDGDYDDDFEE